jgi:hypothetical protein
VALPLPRPFLGAGIMKIALGDFLRQLATVKVLNARSDADRLRYLWRFLRFFAGSYWPYPG